MIGRRLVQHTATAIGTALGTAIGTALLLGCGGPSPDQRVTTALDLLPTEIRMAAAIGNLAELHQNVEIDSIEARHPELARRISSALESQLGFDFLNPAALRESGVDPTRPLAMAVLTAPAGASVVVIPGDGAKLGERLTGLHTRRGAAPRQVADQHGTPIMDADRSQTAWLPLSRFLVVVSGIQPADQRRQVCLDLLSGAGETALANDDAFIATRARLADALENAHPDLWIYTPPSSGAAARRIETPFGDLELPSIVTGTGDTHGGRIVAMSLSETSAVLTVVTEDAHTNSPAGERDATRAFLARVPSDPILFAHANMNIPEAWAAADPSDGWRAGASHEARRLLGVELNQLAPNLGDGAGLILNQVGLMGTDLVVYAGITDRAALQRDLDAMAAASSARPIRLPFGLKGSLQADTIAGVGVHRLSLKPFLDIVIGLVDGHLVVTTTVERFQSIVTGGPSVLDRLPEPSTRTSFDTHQFVASMDAERFASTVGPLMAMVPAIPSLPTTVLDILAMFDDGALVASTVDGAYVGRVTLTRSAPGLWPELVDRGLSSLER